MALVDHLRESSEDMEILRYLTKEYWTLGPTMHTVPTMRKVRTRLLELGVVYVRYHKISRLWTYWNDYTAEGLAVWEESAANEDKEVAIQDKEDKELEDEADIEEYLSVSQVAKRSTASVDVKDPFIISEGDHKMTSPDPPADKDPPAALATAHASGSANDEEAYHSDALPAMQSPQLLLPSSAPAEVEWFQSPPRHLKPYTGKLMMMPLPTRLQHMVQNLQDHDDWYEEEQKKAAPTQTIHQSQARQMDEDGFITVTPQRGSRTGTQPTTRMVPTTADVLTPTTHHNRYHVLMDEVMDKMTAHAKMLEDEAVAHHTTRLGQARTEIETAATDALGQIQEATVQLERHCESQLESLISDLDNFSGQAHQIQQDILNGVRDGTNAARTVPIDDDDELPQPTVSPQSQEHQGPKAGNSNAKEDVPVRRWTKVDYDAIQHPLPKSSPKHAHPAQAPSPVGTQGEDKYADPNYQLPRLRATTTPTMLRTRDRKAVVKFYNAFADMLMEYRVPIKTFDQLSIENLEDPSNTIYPDSLTTESPWFRKYSAPIYVRLEEEGILDPNEPIYRGKLQLYNQMRDGYSVLKSILAATLMVDAKNIGQLRILYLQQTFQRHYTEREQATMFLQGMRQVRTYATAAMQLMHDMEQQPTSGQLSHKLVFPNLPLTLASHPATLPSAPTTTEYTPAHLNVTRADRTGTRGGNPARPRRGEGAGSRTPQKDTQCPACATYGHELMDCKVLPKVAACMEYMQTNSLHTQTILRKYTQMHNPVTQRSRQQAREALANKLQGHLPASSDIDLDDLVEDITESLFHTDMEDEHDGGATLNCLQATPELDSTFSPSMAIQPVKYHLWAQIADATETPPLLAVPDLPGERTQDSASTRVTVSVSAVQHRDLADTGASVSATGLRDILHDFTTDTRYEITGYDGTVTKAAGKGYAHVRNQATNTIDRILFVYTPTITGTIFSLEHHAQTHPRIHRWTQEATPSSNGGWITFYDVANGVVSKYPTIHAKGVYYIQDMQFEPPSDVAAALLTDTPCIKNLRDAVCSCRYRYDCLMSMNQTYR